MSVESFYLSESCWRNYLRHCICYRTKRFVGSDILDIVLAIVVTIFLILEEDALIGLA